MKNTPLKYRLNVVGGALIIFVCVRTYLPILARHLGMRENFDIWLIVYSITLVLSCLFPIAFIEKMADFHPMLFKKHSFKSSDGIIVLGCVFLFTVFTILNSLLLSLIAKFGIAFPPQTLEPITSGLTLILYFIFSAVIPAISEELFMRGIVLNLLLPNGRRFAVITSALLFTVMHTQLQSFPYVFCSGIVLACVYLYTEKIYIPMLLHFTNNAYSFVIMYMQQRVNGISAMGFASFLMGIIIVGGGFCFLLMRKRNMNIFACLGVEEKNAKVSKIFTCPVMVLGLGCCMMAVFTQLYADLIM